ncbi:MAG: hypothetical protein JW700_01555 [Candidatus Aenigmarchaeota archaeon]|nr:hypothetical protein [Candidatus Aenigmarchaeota archaeon]
MKNEHLKALGKFLREELEKHNKKIPGNYKLIKNYTHACEGQAKHNGYVLGKPRKIPILNLFPPFHIKESALKVEEVPYKSGNIVIGVLNKKMHSIAKSVENFFKEKDYSIEISYL